MITQTYPTQESTTPLFGQAVSLAIGALKQQLQRDYEQAYPELREIIHLVLEEEEQKAWALSPFPHLLLPDLIEAHIAKLNLRPARTTRQNLRRKDNSPALMLPPALAFCS
jgi:hypothetical protein